MIKNATKEAMINVEINEKTISVIVYATGIYPKSSINFYNSNREIIIKSSRQIFLPNMYLK
jgi:hypothetical protein